MGASRSAASRASTGLACRAPSPTPAEEAGYPYLPDQNGEFVDGYFPVAFNNQDERRVSAAMGYLDADVRRRPNLTLMTRTHVTRLLFEGHTLRGREGAGERP